MTKCLIGKLATKPLPSLTITPEDHEGGGWVRLYQTQGEQLVPVTDWFRGYRDLVLDEVTKAGKAEAKQ